jgi:Zn-dependent M16 (insulinase) family peptidase
MAVEQIANGGFELRELEEAKLGCLQTLDAPVAPANRAITAFTWQRQGRTHELREEFRKKVIGATPEDIARAVRSSILSKQGTVVTFLGKELLEKEEKLLKTPLAIIS